MCMSRYITSTGCWKADDPLISLLLPGLFPHDHNAVMFAENEWDMDDVERTGRLLNETGNRYWIQELYDYGGGRDCNPNMENIAHQ